jgi:hypothetical protein
MKKPKVCKLQQKFLNFENEKLESKVGVGGEWQDFKGFELESHFVNFANFVAQLMKLTRKSTNDET